MVPGLVSGPHKALQPSCFIQVIYDGSDSYLMGHFLMSHFFHSRFLLSQLSCWYTIAFFHNVCELQIQINYLFIIVEKHQKDSKLTVCIQEGGIMVVSIDLMTYLI